MLWNNFNTYGWGGFPFHEVDKLQRDVNRLFASVCELPETKDFPAINAWMNDEGAKLTAELPGIEAENIDISVHDKALTISGTRKEDELKERKFYLRQERSNGKFSRTVSLPFIVEADKVQADFKKGILTITLPKAEGEKPKNISVKSV